MFQIQSTSPRKAASALTVLAAIGASGMVAQVAAAAELEPSQGARGRNTQFIGTGFPENWQDWLALENVTNMAEGPGYATWPINFGAGTITSALYRIDKNGESFSYGIPAGANLDFQLILEPWSPTTPDSSNTGPDVGNNTATDLDPGPVTRVSVIAPVGDFDADITPLLQTWQSDPGAYFGVRMFVTSGAERGGVWAPNETDDAPGITANLILEQAPVPEPASAAIVGLASAALVMWRRR
jgi:hypothetical protein